MISKRIRIMCWAHADGLSDTFTLDLLNDPYWVGDESVQGYGGQIINWFANKVPPKGEPTGVEVISGANSAVLNGTVITINVSVAPEGTLYQIMLGLLFRPITATTVDTTAPIA